MNDSVRIRLSWGLIALAVIHAAICGVIALVAYPKAEQCQPSNNWSVPYRQPSPIGDSVTSRVDRFETPPVVNLNAQNELKQAGPCASGTCAPLYINGERVVHIGPSRVVTPVVNQTPAKHPIPDAVDYPATIPAASTSQKQPAKKEYQIALFLDRSAKSQQIADWFGKNENLLKLKRISDFQIYTAQNAIYQARFADIVPVDQFPVILFQDASGGHIHAAGRNMIPSTVDELWSDICKGQQLWKQAKNGNVRMTGAIKSKGYSWDSEILPSMQLQQNTDCPDGNCPTPDTSWRPFDRVRPDSDGGLFDGVPGRNAFIWANGGELATMGLMALAAFLVFFILIKRGS